MNSKQYMINWIKENTKDCNSVLELGCRYGDRLKIIHNDALKFGIEIHKPFLDASPYDFTKLHGDILDFDQIILDSMDCVMLIDVIEHLNKDDGIELIKRLQAYGMSKILIQTPNGQYEQGPEPGNKYNAHRSTWINDDLDQLGFKTNVVSNFFPPSGGNTRNCLFAIWSKDE